MLEALAKGVVIGFAIAVPVGPIGLLAIRRSLEGGFGAGLSTGLGAATADFVYGMVVALGFASLAAVIEPVRVPMQLLGGAALVYLAVSGLRPRAEAPRPAHARSFFTTFLLTLGNPATILSFLAIVASQGLGLEGWDPPLLAAGVFLGSAAWWLMLAGGISLVRHQLGAGFRRGLDWLSALLLGGFGAWAMWSGLVGLHG